VQVELSYWGVDMDEEPPITLEIYYTAPTALVAGKPLTLSYRPATGSDYQMLQKYDGNLAGTPLCLIHMYPQLKLGGVVVDENVGKDAEISMGFEETLRVKMLEPGDPQEPIYQSVDIRKNDYKITVGDHVAIVPGLGNMPKEQLQESMQRLSQAVTDGAQDIDRLLGEQLHLTGSTYYYQTDTWYDLIAKQAGVRWFRNPSDLIVSRHLTVDIFLNMIPTAVKESTIIIDAPGNRFQALPEQGDWKNRVAFLKTAGMYGSIMEHTVLQELFQQNAVSGVKLLNAAVDNGTAIHEITNANMAEIIPNLNLSADTIEIIYNELNLGQTVLAPEKEISVGKYRGAAVISSTPADNPMGAFREGYLIARAADGGQITDIIRTLLDGFVNPKQADWLQFQKTAEGAVSSIITNSNDIRDGHLQVRDLLNGVTGMAMSWYMCMAQASASALHSLDIIGVINAGLNGMDDFLSKNRVMYIDFEGNPYYFSEYDNGSRTVKFVVLDLLGKGVKDQTPIISVDAGNTIGFTCTQVMPTSAQGVGEFVFKALNSAPGENFKVSLKINQGADITTTSGTFYTAKVEMAVDGNGDGNVIFSDTDDKKIEFWVNDDYDTNKDANNKDLEIEDDGRASSSLVANCDDDVINTERDLEDFTRLHVSVEGILDKKLVPSYFFKFENITTGLKPEINIFEAVDETLHYLDGKGVNNHSYSLKQLKKGKLVTVTGNDSFISAQYIDQNDKSYFIFEGKNEGKGDLVLVLKINGKEICKTKIEMTLRGIEKYYQKWTLSATDDDIVQMPSSYGPIGDLEYEPNTEDYVIYVHGWRMLPGEKKRWAETMFKRLWWQGYRGYFSYLDWPTLWVNSDYVSLLSNPENFDRSEYRAYQTGKYLAGILSALKNSPHGGRVRILAHSMGNTVVGEAIRQLPDDGGYLLTYIATQPAVSAHAYDNTLPNDAPFLFSGINYGPDTPEVLGNYFVNNRWKMFPSGMFRYFNIKDPALKGWEKNNFLKPDNNYHYIGNEVSYTPPPAGTDRFFKDIGNGEKDLTFNIELERYEILSRCVESRSKTLGSVSGHVSGFYDIDLNDKFEFGSKDYDHSRQFMSNIIREWPYWNLFMTNCMLK